MPTKLEVLTPDIPSVEKFFNGAGGPRARFEKVKDRNNEDLVETAVNGMNKVVRLVLKRISDLVRTAQEDQTLSPEELRSLVTNASDLENTIINWNYSQDLLDKFIPVFCGNDHSDSASGGPLIGVMADFLSGMGLEGDKKGSRLTPYKNVPTPGPGSSSLARFSMDEKFQLRRLPIPPKASPALIALTQARCEISARGTNSVAPFDMVACDSMLAIAGPCGFTQRDPALQLFPLDPEHKIDDYLEYGTDVNVGLSAVGTTLALDESRRLAFVGDSSRIKSYRWADGAQPATLPVHTLASEGYGGMLLLRDGGAKLLRSGPTGVAVWDVDNLPTHGPKGTTIVGGKMSERGLKTSRAWEDGDIEFSGGALPTHRLPAAALSNIGIWKDHPNDRHSVIVRYGGRFSPSLVNMETQQLVTHYIGHGGFTLSFATSREDPNCFVTGAKDGCVRLYDVRLPTPVLAIDHGEDSICSVLYEHVDGQPFVMLGGTRSEQIKVWDIRGPTPLYELSTGNNQVNDLAWDASRQTLYAATQCSYMAPSGYHYGYRPARFKFWEKDDNDERGDEPDELGRCWPDRAPHTEAAFGYPLDSSEHRIYRYKFKHDADVKVLPPYGDASCDESDGFGGFGGMPDLGGLNLADLGGLGGGQDGECIVC